MDKRWLFIPLAGIVLFFLASVSKPSLSLAGAFSKPEAVPELRGDTLTVISMNILHGFPFFRNAEGRLAAIAEEIKQAEADVVLIQEDFWSPGIGRAAKLLSQASGLPYYAFARANGNRRAILFETGQAILSRYPLHNAGVKELPQGRSPFEHRIVLYASIMTPKGSMGLFCVHLTNGNSNINEAQMSAVISLVDSLGYELSVIGGDFNAEPLSATMQKVPGTWTDLVYSPGEKGRPTCCVPTLDPAVEDPWTKKIDYLFASTKKGNPFSTLARGRCLDRPLQCGSLFQFASDHAGLWAKLGLE